MTRGDIKASKAWIVNEQTLVVSDTIEEAIEMYRLYNGNTYLYTDVLSVKRVDEPEKVLIRMSK